MPEVHTVKSIAYVILLQKCHLVFASEMTRKHHVVAEQLQLFTTVWKIMQCLERKSLRVNDLLDNGQL